jgi:DNA-binding transcriptional MerR regulator
MQDVEQRLYRRRDAARILGLSESMCLQLERRGLLEPLRLASVGRTVRYEAQAVHRLADRLIAEARKETA